MWFRQRAWARSSTASAIYHTCVMSLVTCNWIRGEMCGALDAESSDRGANPREASLRRECAWDCGHANAADTGKHAQASKHKQHKQKTGKHSQAQAGRQGQSSLGRALHLPALSGVEPWACECCWSWAKFWSARACLGSRAMPGGDASTVQWLRSWSSDFIETRWASWAPSRQLRERRGGIWRQEVEAEISGC